MTIQQVYLNNNKDLIFFNHFYDLLLDQMFKDNFSNDEDFKNFILFLSEVNANSDIDIVINFTIIKDQLKITNDESIFELLFKHINGFAIGDFYGDKIMVENSFNATNQKEFQKIYLEKGFYKLFDNPNMFHVNKELFEKNKINDNIKKTNLNKNNVKNKI